MQQGTERGLGRTGKRTPRTYALNSLGPVVYAARMGDGLIKIGFTNRLGRRLWDLTYRAGSKAELLGFRPGSRADEGVIHVALRDSLDHGREWFQPTEEVLAVVNEMREEFGLPTLAT